MKTPVIILIVTIYFTSCSNNGPEPIHYNQDACEFCKMSISESRFAAELITVKGRVYKFDDLQCLLQYQASNKELTVKNYYVGDFLKEQQLIDATTAFFVKNETLRSPMAGNTAAFADKETAQNYADKNRTGVTTWNDLRKTVVKEGNHDNGHPQH